MVKKRGLLAFSFIIFVLSHGVLRAQDAAGAACVRPAVGGSVTEPADLRSRDGVLQVDLTIQNYKEPDGSTRYCYIDEHGNQAPNLRLKPGDLLILRLKNEITDIDDSTAPTKHSHSGMAGM